MAPWALFLDIDGTLIASDYVIPERSLNALKRAREAGHKVILNTGRSLGNIPHDIFDQIEVDAVISGNGSAVTVGGKLIFSSFMDRGVFLRIAKAVYDDESCWAVFEGLSGSYIIPGRRKLLSRSEIDSPTYESLVENTQNDNIQVVAVSKSFSPDLIKELRRDMQVYEFPTYYDIVTAGNNKALRMQSTLDYFGISPECTMAFGDSENDIDMLKAAAIGVAVSNSQQKVLDIADYVALSNAEGGVGEAIEKFLPKGE